MKRENLISFETTYEMAIAGDIVEEIDDMYIKKHADSVMDELEERIKELEAENDRLKKEVADYHQLQWQHDALIDENERLKGENAKLKCLILHLFGLIGFYASEWYSEYDEERQVRRAVKWWKIHIKYNKAYLKAKKALREGSNA